MLRSALNRLSAALGNTARPAASTLRSFNEESFSRYSPGGYHPVRLEDTFSDGRYKVICKLGYGVYSTVWLAFDQCTKQHLALKILTADSCNNKNGTFELEILEKIKAKSNNAEEPPHILGLIDHFNHQGPHGKHVCLVFNAMGPDVSKFRRLFPRSRVPLHRLKGIARELLAALAFLHDACKVIHCDIKPQNLLIETPKITNMFARLSSDVFCPRRPPLEPPNDFYMESSQFSSAEENLPEASSVSIRLADFNTASWYDHHLTEWIQPQTLRAPEVILGATWDEKVDIWNLGLIIWELAEGSLMFDGTWTAKAPYSTEAHLAQMKAILGQLLEPSTFPDLSLEGICRNPALAGQDRVMFLDLIGCMIRLEPRDRPAAREILGAEWLK